MDKKTYKRTRYQNIYKHIKNGNYLVMMSKPVKTSISRIDGKKILTIDEAIKIRDNIVLKKQKGLETIHKEDFDTLWDKYMYDCKYVKKLAYNTLCRKEKMYNKYLKNKIKKPISKTDKNFWSNFISIQICSYKQKNEVLKCLRTCFNWCLENDYLISNPVQKIQDYKVETAEMKYWIPDEIKKFFKYLNDIINNNSVSPFEKEHAYRIKILALIGFSLGDRVGETRALTFDSFNELDNTVTIAHSINYDRKSDNFLSSTKTYQSQRVIDISDTLIQEIKKYKEFLINECGYNVKNNSLIFFNYKNKMPYSDTSLRKMFYKYCDEANVTKIRMYDLRHTYVATMMSEGNELYLFSKRIGHSNINTTVNKYGHLSNEVKKKLAKSTDKYI